MSLFCSLEDVCCSIYTKEDYAEYMEYEVWSYHYDVLCDLRDPGELFGVNLGSCYGEDGPFQFRNWQVVW